MTSYLKSAISDLDVLKRLNEPPRKLASEKMTAKTISNAPHIFFIFHIYLLFLILFILFLNEFITVSFLVFCKIFFGK